MADVIVVNSQFTASVFKKSFITIPREPSVLYPGINLEAYDTPVDYNDESVNGLHLDSKTQVILSINRFERKKNIGLAIEAFSSLKKSYSKTFSSLTLVLAGGYDSRVSENVNHLQELKDLATGLGLSTHVWKKEEKIPAKTQIIFVPSFTNQQRAYLLSRASCLLYTPSNEHFGIVPLESMYSRLPVVACKSGGPLETIVSEVTGFLCDPTPEGFAEAIGKIISNPEKKKEMGMQGRKHVTETFSMQTFSDRLEQVVFQTKESFNADALITYYCTVLFFCTLLPLWALSYFIKRN